MSGEQEGIPVEEKIKRIRLAIANTNDSAKRDELGKQLLELTIQKSGRGKGDWEQAQRIQEFRKEKERMHNAAEVAEKTGVGTGGKGSQEG